MKTKEELNALKEEVETVSRKLHELTEEELAQVVGSGDGVVGTLTDELIQSGDFLVSTRFTYNNETYEMRTGQGIPQIGQYHLFQTKDGKSLLIPEGNIKRW